MHKVDKVIFGAGIYGLYAALVCSQKNERVVVLEYDDDAFSRATFVNQGRIHKGYHYPRSFSTAIKSAEYFQRFCDEFSFCIHKKFNQLYATSKKFSWVNAQQFNDFCTAANIECEEVQTNDFLKENSCDGIFETREYAFDAKVLKEYFLERLSAYKNCSILYRSRINRITKKENYYFIEKEDGTSIRTDFILNTTYANINQVQNLLGFQPFKIHYEICEIIICKVSEHLKDVGITIMDGPFFSLMPFGKTGYHTLSAVQYTPHKSYEGELPKFDCQDNKVRCNMKQLENCNHCVNKPVSNWEKMYKLAKKYLKDEIDMEFVKSMFAMKAVLIDSEIDDARPTIIKQFSEKPHFYSVFSGKINFIYEMENIL